MYLSSLIKESLLLCSLLHVLFRKEEKEIVNLKLLSIQDSAFKIVIHALPTCFPGVILTLPLLLWVLRMAFSACSQCYGELSASGNLHHEEHMLMSFLLFIFFHLDIHQAIFMVANTPCNHALPLLELPGTFKFIQMYGMLFFIY